MSVLKVAVVLALLSVAGCDTVGLDERPVQEADLEVWDEMLDAVNVARAEGGVCGSERIAPSEPLVWDARLELAARRHTLDLVKHNMLSHTGSDGLEPGDRVLEAGYEWRVVGENLIRGRNSLDTVIEDWLESPGHCRQILNPVLSEMGAAEVDGYWTQVFGVPR